MAAVDVARIATVGKLDAPDNRYETARALVTRQLITYALSAPIGFDRRRRRCRYVGGTRFENRRSVISRSVANVRPV